MNGSDRTDAQARRDAQDREGIDPGHEDRVTPVHDESAEAPEATDPRFALDEAADGECTPELAERLQRHWETCPECAQEVERVLRMKALVRRCCAAETAPASLRERISIEVHRTRTEVSVRRTRSITITER